VSGPHLGDLLSGYLDGELPEDHKAAAEAHLAACAECRDELEVLKALSATVSGLGFRYTRTAPRMRQSSRSLLRWTAAAATVLLAAGAGILTLRRMHPPVKPEVVTETRLADGTRLAWSADAAIHLLGPRGHGPVARLDSGSLYVEAAKGKDPLRIQTPAGTVTVLGTRFRIAASPARASVSVFEGRVSFANPLGEAFAATGQEIRAEAGSLPESRSRSLTSGFADLYRPVAAEVAASLPPTRFPLDPAGIVNWPDAKRLRLPEAARRAVLERGFAVIPWNRTEANAATEIPAAYESLKELGVPSLVTPDALLHLYQLQFGESLARLEEGAFTGDLEALCRTLGGRCLKARDALDPGQHAEEEGALGLAAQYFAVTRTLLNEDGAISSLPRDLKPAAEAELGLLAAAAGPARSPLFGCEEDYTQYRPRGHYVRNETLRRYFRATAWLGRMRFLLRDSRQTLAALQISEFLDQEHLPDGRTAREAWERIYAVTAFTSGVSGDLTPADCLEVLHETGRNSGEIVSDASAFDRVKEILDLRRPPEVFSGSHRDPGLSLLGCRFGLDAAWMDRLSAPALDGVFLGDSGDGTPFSAMPKGDTLVRGFPRGLDVMALLGSRRAESWLDTAGDDDFEGYREARGHLRSEAGLLSPEEWNANLHSGWLWSLKPLLQPAGEGWPGFMRSEAWQDRSLNTALASWTALRHDGILAARDAFPYRVPMTTSEPSPTPAGWVEPQPECYARLLTLNRMTEQGLRKLKALDTRAAVSLQSMDRMLASLLQISLDELAGKDPSAEQRAFLDGIAGQIRDALPEGDTSAPLTADVHWTTDQVLQEATGNLDLLVAAVPRPDGGFFLAAGPVLSSYEFKRPISQRLTDSTWRGMLEKAPPQRPAWARDYLIRP